jgi:hypothetical protein
MLKDNYEKNLFQNKKKYYKTAVPYANESFFLANLMN